MFDLSADPLTTLGLTPAWSMREPMPGEAGYEAYLAHVDQQIAFWNDYARSDAAPEDLLPGAVPDDDVRIERSLLGAIGRADRDINAAEGRKLRAIGDFATWALRTADPRDDERSVLHSVEAEIGLELHVPPVTASRWLHLALRLRRRLPKTLAALEDGTLSRPAAEMVADETENLNVARCARLEDTVLPDAGQRSYRSLRNKVRRTVEKLDADAVRKRAEAAKEERCVYVKDEHDGMATLCLYGPAGVVHSLYNALNERVHAAQATAAAAGQKDARRVGALRLDTIVDILGTGLGIDPYTPPVPEPSFLTEEQIAVLDKHGDTYRPTGAMKAAVRNRDKHCRFPGCRRPARQCDLDHTIAFKIGGRTVYFNLGCICRLHHQVKQMDGWHLAQDRGRFIWTAPNGMRFIVHPPPDDDEAEPADFVPYEPGDEEIPF